MIIVCWNMQKTGYPGADAFARAIATWNIDVLIMLEPPEWAHNSRLLGSDRGRQWNMEHWSQHAGDRVDKHQGAITTLAAPNVTVRRKGELYPDSGVAMPRQLLVFKITKGNEVRRVATCHAPFTNQAYVHYVREAVRELRTFSETPRKLSQKRHIHPVDIWIGDLNTAGDRSPNDELWVLKFARATTMTGAQGGSPRDKVLVRAGSDLAGNASAGRVLGRNGVPGPGDWQIGDWEMEVSSDHCPVYLNTGGAAPAAIPGAAAAAAVGGERDQKRPSLSRQYGDIQDKARNTPNSNH